MRIVDRIKRAQLKRGSEERDRNEDLFVWTHDKHASKVNATMT